MSQRFSRRAWLGGAAALAGSQFFRATELPDWVTRSLAHAAPGDSPTRLLLIGTRHGFVEPSLRMSNGNESRDTGYEVALAGLAESAFSEILRPLYRHRRKMTVLGNLSMSSAYADIPFHEHEKGQIHALTGKPLALRYGRPFAAGPSIDQWVANRIARSGRIRSMEFGTHGNQLVFNDDGQALPLRSNPLDVATLYFPLSNIAPNTDEDRVRREQAGLVTRLEDRYRALMPTLGGEAGQAVDAHRQLLSDLRTRLAALETFSCGAPPVTWQDVVPRGDESMNWTAQLAAWSRIITAAFSCDLTRVISLQLGQLPNRVFGAPAGDVHQDFAHYDMRTGDAGNNARRWMSAYHAKHAEQIATLLDVLESTPEQGGSLLDRTLVMWVNELANGSHHFAPYHVVLFGSERVRHGRYINFASLDRAPRGINVTTAGPARVGPPHQQLLRTVAEAFRLPQGELAYDAIASSDGGNIATRDVLPNVLL